MNKIVTLNTDFELQVCVSITKEVMTEQVYIRNVDLNKTKTKSGIGVFISMHQYASLAPCTTATASTDQRKKGLIVYRMVVSRAMTEQKLSNILPSLLSPYGITFTPIIGLFTGSLQNKRQNTCCSFIPWLMP